MLSRLVVAPRAINALETTPSTNSVPASPDQLQHHGWSTSCQVCVHDADSVRPAPPGPAALPLLPVSFGIGEGKGSPAQNAYFRNAQTFLTRQRRNRFRSSSLLHDSGAHSACERLAEPPAQLHSLLLTGCYVTKEFHALSGCSRKGYSTYNRKRNNRHY